MGEDAYISEKLDKILVDFEDVFSEDLPNGMSPSIGMSFKIETLSGSVLVSRSIYRLSRKELDELQKTLKE